MKVINSILFFLSLLVWAMLSVSCTGEEYPVGPSPDKGEQGGGILTFTLGGGGQQSTTYSGAGDDDYIQTLEIYMFEAASGKLSAVFRFTEDELEESNQPGQPVSVSVDVTGRSGANGFYFVANGAGYASALANINVGTTTEEEFCRWLSDVREDNITLPLLMTTSARIEDIEAPQPGETTIHLRRCVASIGIENDPEVTGFTIDKILVSNANLQTSLFGGGCPTEELAKGSLPEIDYGSLPGANANVPLEHVFYLFPTQVAEGQTEIWMDGTFRGSKLLYRLQTDFQVEANHRYTLRVSETAYPMEVLPMISTGDEGRILVSGNRYDVSALTDAVELSFPVRTFSGQGTHVEMNYLDGLIPNPGIDYMYQPQTPLQEGGYLEEHQFYLPVQYAPFRIQLIIINNRLSSDRDTFYIEGIPDYPNTLLKPVRVGGIYWAPVNVGVEGVNAKPEDPGSYFQWGRNTAFDYYLTNPTDLYYSYGPVLQKSIELESVRNKFIRVNKVEPNDWLTPQDGTLWSADKSRGPCPEGWRIPTAEELSFILNARDEGRIEWNSAARLLFIRGDDDDSYLFFPFAGSRSYYDGTSRYRGDIGYYWSSDPDGVMASRIMFRRTTQAIELYRSYRAAGNSVRCVQQ